MSFKPTAALCLFILIAGCAKTNQPTVTSSGKDPAPLPAPSVPIEDLIKSNQTQLLSLKLQATSTLTENAQGTPVINLMSPQSFVDSIKAIEPSLSAEDKMAFRLTLASFVDSSQFKIEEITKTYANPKQVPKFTDQQLLMITFGALEGLTGQQAIQKARTMGYSLQAP